MDISYVNTISVTDYNNLRVSAGWGPIPEKQAQAGIDNSTYKVAAIVDGRTVGMVRLITDGGCVNFIQDVVVLPEYQRQSIGMTMLQMVMDYIKDHLQTGEIAYVGLMAAMGKEDFYKKFGFEERPNDHHGAGMTQWIRK